MSENYDHIPTVPHPEVMNIVLYRHQLASIYRMEKFEKDKTITYDNNPNKKKEISFGLLTDPAGYGKTSSIIGLIIRNKMSWDMDDIYTISRYTSEFGGTVNTIITTEYYRIDCTIVLVSPSLICQWEQELSETELNIGIITTKRQIETLDVNEQDVILINIPMFNKFIDSYHEYAWKRFIFDEPGHTRVPGMRNVVAGFTWYVTATPSAIYSEHHCCHGSMIKDTLCKGQSDYNFTENIKEYCIQNDLGFIRESFTMPETRYEYHVCKQVIARCIFGMVNNNISEMIEAGNIEGAVTALGGTQTDNIIDLVKQRKQAEIDEARYKIRYHEMRNNIDALTEWTMRKTRLENQLAEIDARFNNALNDNCPICIESIKRPVLAACCQNIFCGDCIMQCLRHRSSCPMCRDHHISNKLVYINTGNNERPESPSNNSTNGPLTKMEQTIKLIKDKPDGKFLVFSGYDQTFTTITDSLRENNISYVLIKGSAKIRERNLNAYKNGQDRVILLNSRVNSAGLNLQETTDIIMYYEMSSHFTHQIVGRAERIGRRDPLTVHTLV